jgi:protein SCO1
VLALACAAALLLLRHWGLAPGSEGGAASIVETIPLPRLQTAPQDDRRASALNPAPDIAQKLGAELPLGLHLLDAEGSPVDRTALLAGGKPIVLLPAWYRCDTLCGTTAHGALEALADTGLSPSAWRLVLFSIDPQDSPADAHVLQDVYLKYAKWSRPSVFSHAPDVRLLTGNAAETRALARTIGFDWVVEPATTQSGLSGYSHAAGLVVVTPKGLVSRYVFGVRFEPRALRSALIEASDGRIGSLAERLMLACSHFDPQLGSHDFTVMTVIRSVCALVLLSLAAGLWHLQRRRRWLTRKGP